MVLPSALVAALLAAQVLVSEASGGPCAGSACPASDGGIAMLQLNTGTVSTSQFRMSSEVAKPVRLGFGCWSACGQKSGWCPACGEGGACCREDGVNSQSAECQSRTGYTKPNGHQCVVGKGQEGETASEAAAEKKVSHTFASAKGSGCCAGPVRACFMYGDPHIRTFDGAFTRVAQRSAFAFWVVHSDAFQLQAHSDKGGRIHGVATGGEFLKGHTLAIHGRDHKSGEVLFDGKSILTKDGDKHIVEGVCELYRYKSKTVVPDEKEMDELDGKHNWWKSGGAKKAFESTSSPLYHFKFNKGVELYVMWHKSMNLLLKMSSQEKQGGYCGNFNGDPDDDQKHPGRSGGSGDEPAGPNLEPIPEEDDLLKAVGVSLAATGNSSWEEEEEEEEKEEGGGAAAASGASGCDPALRKQAEQACKHIPEEDVRHSCIDDVCTIGRLSAAEDSEGMEELEVKEDHGVVMFYGEGRCTDQDGETFSSFEAAGVAEKKGCSDLLTQMADTMEGVRGAELKDGSKCHILADPGVNLTVFEIPGGWGATAEGAGKGIVSSIMDGAYECWKVV